MLAAESDAASGAAAGGAGAADHDLECEVGRAGVRQGRAGRAGEADGEARGSSGGRVGVAAPDRHAPAPAADAEPPRRRRTHDQAGGHRACGRALARELEAVAGKPRRLDRRTQRDRLRQRDGARHRLERGRDAVASAERRACRAGELDAGGSAAEPHRAAAAARQAQARGRLRRDDERGALAAVAPAAAERGEPPRGGVDHRLLGRENGEVRRRRGRLTGGGEGDGRARAGVARGVALTCADRVGAAGHVIELSAERAGAVARGDHRLQR